MSVGLKVRTAWKLGLGNVCRVSSYRLGLRTRLHSVVRLRADIAGEKFFAPQWLFHVGSETLPPASQRWTGSGLYFGWHEVPLEERLPDWYMNPFRGTVVAQAGRPWYRIPDFDPVVGDIKAVWEPSRFDWLLPMAQRARHGDIREIKRMNVWLANWCRANPAYRGPNWKCGQEASIRVIHLAVAARLLGEDTNTRSDLLQLVKAHMMRIYPTISYAIGQDNNHGTSEATGLFIGGHWCRSNGLAEGARWARAGRRLLENRVRRLIAMDGSFSQYSVNYHRLMLDTLCVAELWRQWHRLEPFSQGFYERARAATFWLYSLVNEKTGDAPNIGANDGARLLPLTDTDYRDYRPTVQLAMALFAGQRAYSSEGPYNDHLGWLGVPVPEKFAARPGSTQFDHGGYAILRNGSWFAVMRYPRYRFRPSQCDALHVDLWYENENLLRDSGSYSYNTEAVWQGYFPGTVSHNTIQFDDRDQMPRLGRFLWGAWPEARDVDPVKSHGESVSTGAMYRDWKGARHSRRVCLSPGGLTVRDDISGFSRKAVLRWRLMPGDWKVSHMMNEYEHRVIVVGSEYQLEIQTDVPIVRCELVQGWESRYYLQKTPLPVLEVEVQTAGSLTTKFCRPGN